MSDDEGVFADFGDAQEAHELVEIPRPKMGDEEYVARVLSMGAVYRSDESKAALERYLDRSAEIGEKNASLIKLLRALLLLDGEKEAKYVRDDVPDDEMVDEISSTIVETGFKRGYGGRELPISGKGWAETLAHIAASETYAQTADEFQERVSREFGFVEMAYRSAHDLAEALVDRQGDMLTLTDVVVMPGTQALAEIMLGNYPVLRSEGIRDRIFTSQDLCDMVGASLVQGIIDNSDLAKAVGTAIKSNTPPQLTWSYALDCLSYENVLRIGRMVANTGPEGYHG